MTAKIGMVQVTAAQAVLPAGKRIPAGWNAAAVGPGAARTQIAWHLGRVSGRARLRLSAAVDIREEKLIEVRLGDSGERIGCFDIRFANVFQPHEIRLTEKQAQAAVQEGIELQLVQGKEPFWFLTEAPRGLETEADLLLPHLLCEERLEGSPLQHFYKTMASVSSIQPFGWMEGCVLDGLLDLHEACQEEAFRSAAATHIRLFQGEDGRLSYENPRSEPVEHTVYGMEGTLPFAGMMRLWGQHPLIEPALNFWRESQDQQGHILDGGMLSAEGSYTVAYPMALAARFYEGNWRTLALKQLKVRAERLVVDGQLYLRLHEDGSRSFKNWARAHAWYLLGLVRTLDALGHSEDTAEHERELERALKAALAWQRADGLWSVFIDQPAGRADASGSAGIAAAAALAVRGGWFSMNDLQRLFRTRDALVGSLTPDGILPGVAQGNKGGVELQQGDYRVMSQMGMGLLGQLLAALPE
ncbi:glycoside hydrolase family 88 protein [Paenibacillus mucilaginosus]|uniref:Glucuronyl hydrolase n=1 Tax=Paenibacillus mucilaginosus (strain KNP414) TaxID=1036673 RepID=F8FQJ5_PAEMK|nr:glycoside hydrolase family 88 protein [Paenibacillus mucilaginosus]AEI40350.1 hypothetical protein KNP414_01788 [Paenibacillus mucilaginosus KNP414]MCG7213292.1 glycoside hydrolase family 88 protein [Paenibacillus mucilaginosus]WDM29551.1 glycoside hydrolase family 88 protein [Paenibacillus mucilaginosus]